MGFRSSLALVAFLIKILFATGIAFSADAKSLKDVCAIVRNESSPQFGCSGALVSETGGITSEVYFATVKHCGLGPRVIVLSTSGQRRGIKIYDSPKSEGPVIFKLEGGDKWPTIRIAATIQNGAKTRFGGFTAAKLTNFMEGQATISGAGFLKDFPGVKVNITTNRTIPGMSGGPLVNDNLELIGLNHGTAQAVIGVQGDTGASWIPRDAIEAAFRAAMQRPSNAIKQMINPTQGRLIVFTRDGCIPCAKWSADRKAGSLCKMTRGVVIVKKVDGDWTEGDNGTTHESTLARQFQTATGQSVMSLPTFWVEGTPDFQEGYSATAAGRLDFCGWLNGILGAAGGLINSAAGAPCCVSCCDPVPMPPVVPPEVPGDETFDRPVATRVPSPKDDEIARLRRQVADLARQVDRRNAETIPPETSPPPVPAPESPPVVAPAMTTSVILPVTPLVPVPVTGSLMIAVRSEAEVLAVPAGTMPPITPVPLPVVLPVAPPIIVPLNGSTSLIIVPKVRIAPLTTSQQVAPMESRNGSRSEDELKSEISKLQTQLRTRQKSLLVRK